MKRFTIKLISEDGETLTIYNNVNTVSFGSLDRGDAAQIIEWGIYSNRGEISFVDFDGSAKPFLEKSDTEKVKVEIYLSSDLFDRKTATFQIEDYVYNDNTKIVSVSIIDSLQSWQSIEQDEIFLFEDKTAYAVLEAIMESAKSKYDVDLIIDLNTKSYLRGFMIDCPHLRPNNLWGNVNKICEITMCRVFDNEDGVPQMVYDNRNGTPIVIRPHNIISISNESTRKKNKLPLITLSVKDRVKYIGRDLSQGTTYSVYDFDGVAESAEVGDQEITFTRVSWRFIGGDESINGNTKVTEILVDNYGTQKDVHVELEQSVHANTHAVTSCYTLGTVYDEPDPATKWENMDCPHDEDTEIISFDRDKGVVNLDFVLPESFMSGRDALSTARTIAKGNFYEDKRDLVYTRGVVDDTYPLSPQKLTSNELMQKSNAVSLYETLPHYVWLLNEVSRKYGNGADSCEIECNFGDYFTEDGTKVIDSSGFVTAVQGFARYDVVIPYIVKGGKTVPYKTDENGNPKEFKVIGIKYACDGILRQTLCLQEHIL